MMRPSIIPICSMVSGRIRRSGYVRIEHEAGVAARLAMSEYNSDAIDKLTDARANMSARRERTAKR